MEIDILKSLKTDKKEFLFSFIIFGTIVLPIWFLSFNTGNFKSDDIIISLIFLIFMAFGSFLMMIGTTISYIVSLLHFKKDKKSIKSSTTPLTTLQKETALKNIEQKINFFEYLLDDSHTKYDTIRIASKLSESFDVSILEKKEQMVAILHQSRNTKNAILDNEPLDIAEINELNKLMKYNHYGEKLKQLL